MNAFALKNTQRFQILVIVLACGVAFPLKFPQDAEKPRAPASSESQRTGMKMWNGGKPSAQLQVTTSLEGKIPAEAELPFSIFVTPEIDCERLTARARGIDGLEIAEAGVQNLGAAPRGRSLEVTGKLHSAPNSHGYLVVDLSCESAAGTHSLTRSFPLYTDEAAAPVPSPAPGAGMRTGESTPKVRLVQPSNP